LHPFLSHNQPRVFIQIHPELKIPVNALGLVSICCCLLALINIGSTTAFYAVLSLATLSLYISYIVPITLIMIRKIEGRHPAYGPFNLGRWGIPINLFAVLYGAYIIVFLSFPVAIPVTATSMNYAAPVWWAAFIFALGNWFLSASKKFKVPTRHDDLDPLNED
jgi:choline transport protein